ASSPSVPSASVIDASTTSMSASTTSNGAAAVEKGGDQAALAPDQGRSEDDDSGAERRRKRKKREKKSRTGNLVETGTGADTSEDVVVAAAGQGRAPRSSAAERLQPIADAGQREPPGEDFRPGLSSDESSTTSALDRTGSEGQEHAGQHKERASSSSQQVSTSARLAVPARKTRASAVLGKEQNDKKMNSVQKNLSSLSAKDLLHHYEMNKEKEEQAEEAEGFYPLPEQSPFLSTKFTEQEVRDRRREAIAKGGQDVSQIGNRNAVRKPEETEDAFRKRLTRESLEAQGIQYSLADVGGPSGADVENTVVSSNSASTISSSAASSSAEASTSHGPDRQPEKKRRESTKTARKNEKRKQKIMKRVSRKTRPSEGESQSSSRKEDDSGQDLVPLREEVLERGDDKDDAMRKRKKQNAAQMLSPNKAAGEGAFPTSSSAGAAGASATGAAGRGGPTATTSALSPQTQAGSVLKPSWYHGKIGKKGRKIRRDSRENEISASSEDTTSGKSDKYKGNKYDFGEHLAAGAGRGNYTGRRGGRGAGVTRASAAERSGNGPGLDDEEFEEEIDPAVLAAERRRVEADQDRKRRMRELGSKYTLIEDAVELSPRQK
ncbi:unnamed protein product, partial [Amoebophrya sp. A120]